MRTCQEPGCAITLRTNQPADRCNRHSCAPSSAAGDPAYEAALWRETEHSLRRDPSRWVVASASDPDDGDRRESGLRAYVRDERARAAVQANQYPRDRTS